MYVPGELIFKKGEADQKIFYVVKGDVEFFIEEKVLGEIGVIYFLLIQKFIKTKIKRNKQK
jgi:CRP-like cAMP-binding protein